MQPALMPANDRLAVLARRLQAAQLALMVGSPGMRERVERLIGGQLSEADAAAARTELDALAPLLLGS